MNKKGLTLIEILAVISFIGVLLLLVLPSINSFISSRYDEIDEVIMESLENSVRLYTAANRLNYPMNAGDIYCIEINELIEKAYANEKIIEQSDQYQLSDVLKVEVLQNRLLHISKSASCAPYYVQDYYQDNSGASIPVLIDNLIPIVFSGTEFIRADVTKRWYDYDEGQWANAVLVTEESFENYQGGYAGPINTPDILGYFVWIPRYRYSLFNVGTGTVAEQTIDVRFEIARSARAKGDDNGQWYTHPAFEFGEKSLGGFWFGKFTTTGTVGVPRVAPNQTMLRNHSFYTNYTASRNFASNVKVLNARMARNTEWGAVALLSKSGYGNSEEVWSNPNNNYVTGCAGDSARPPSSSNCNIFTSENGVKASTTGNVYGVYDMSGGALESVMGVMVNLAGIFDRAQSDFDEINTLDPRYIDRYDYGVTQSNSDAYERRILGDATSETRGWYSSSSQFVFEGNSFFLRGGNINSPGLFSFNNSPGNDTSGFRLVLSED